jgi:hypothetical protein
MHFDIVHAADLSATGGTSSALRAELKAARRYGLNMAFVPFIGLSEGSVRPFERRTAELVEAFKLPWLTGDAVASCEILFADHPQIFMHMPASAVRVRPKQTICILHHPPFDGEWKAQYDWAVVQRNLERLFGAPVTFAPVGPKVRAQFNSLAGGKPPLLAHDLVNMLDLAEWPARERPAPREAAIVGRHSRPNLKKWPDSKAELDAAYPDRRHLTMRALGGIAPECEIWLGSNWQLLPYADDHVSEFLTGLDFYVYFHSRRWVEAFGMGAAEAMASGLVTVLDPSFESLFEDGAVYAEANDVEAVLERFLASPDAYAGQSAAARRLVERKFALDIFPARMTRLSDELGLPPFKALREAARTVAPTARAEAEAPAALAARNVRPGARRRRVLFVATNGVGLGHITRLMAIAERTSGDIEPIFFTRSAGSALLAERGHATDYIPWSVKMGVTDVSWNSAYAQELLGTIETLDIGAVVFDGTYPFRGLLAVRAVRPDLAWVWVRRGLWVEGQTLDERLATNFHMLIEPGELATDEDRGPTARLPGVAIRVPPILLCDPRQRLPRAEAAARLGTEPGRVTAAIQLGSRRNFDYEQLPELVAADLVRRGLQVVLIANPLARPLEKEWPGVITTSVYPLSDCLSAIDLMVCNAGYNSFHECVYAGVPAIFVPNESPDMDDQQLRAAYAHATGLGFKLRASELGRIGETLDLALSVDFRDELNRRAARLEFVNGAPGAAALIEQLVFSIRTNLPLAATLPRA